MPPPLISIITPSFNQGQFIEQTILSVINQGYHNLEYIIIDGGSTDGTLDIIKKYEQHLKYWVSKKDKGQADAINKGLQYCTGEIFNWINSDDYLAEGALLKIAERFRNPGTGAVAGTVINFKETGERETLINRNISIEGILSPDYDYIYHQPGVWLRMDIMKKVGKFRRDYHYCFDQEYMLRYLLMNKEIEYLPETLAYFRQHPSSKSEKYAARFFWDFIKMYKEFWKANRKTSYSLLAKEKYKRQEWPLLQQLVGQQYKNRPGAFFTALWFIIRDPFSRLNKNNLGWLKHILLGKRQ